MQAQEIGLAKFIGEKSIFVIPVYQRNYDWKKSNCERLFNDVLNVAETGKPHFLGTIVYKSIDNGFYSENIIIDGQQRIASVILLAKALCEVVDIAKKEAIFTTFIKHSDGELKNQLRLKLSEYDSAVFKKLMDSEKFNSDEFDAIEKSSALYINYKILLEKLQSSKCDLDKIYFALGKLKVVQILLQTENPQEIFESLNSTGLDLSNADLIRNYLLMSLDYESQEKLYKEYWLQIELLLKSSDAVENFMVQYLITKRKSDALTEDNKKARLSKRNLYDSFKKYFGDHYNSNSKSEDVENFLKDMYRYAKFYRQVIFNENTNFNELLPLEKKFYELTWLLDSTNAPIILMYLYDRYERKNFDEMTFLKFVDALISLAFRAKVCDYVGISSQFAGNVIARLDKNEFLNEEFFWQVLTFGKGDYAFPRDEEFKTALSTENLYTKLKSYGCKYFLYSLEKFIGSDDLPAYSNTVVEHVIPQRLNKNWRAYLQAQNDSQAHELLVNTLGNLVLTIDKEKIEGEEFSVKKFLFGNSKFFYTKEIANFSNITSKQIQARAKKLANIAVKIWTLPENFNEQIKHWDNIFNLDSAVNFFTNTKPATISICNVEKEVTTWKALVGEVLKQLYSLDTETFKTATLADNVSKYFSYAPANLREPSEIDANLYFESHRSTANFLRFLKAFVGNFDAMSGTNIKDDIWFTLKK